VDGDHLPKRTLVSLAVGAVAVRLAYLAAFARHYRPRRDADHYLTIATSFADADGISATFPFTYQHPTAFRPPLYPALLGAIYWVTGVRVGIGQLLNVALGVAVVVLAALLGAHIAGRLGGVAAGVAVAVYPPLLANDVVLLSEPLSLALLLLMILLLVRDRPGWAGLVCGLLVLTRPSAQLLVVVVAGWLVWRVGWRGAALFSAITVVVIAPWIVRNWVLVGAPVVVTSNGFNLVSTYSVEAQNTKGFADAVFDERFRSINEENRSEADLDDAYREHAIDAVRDHRTIPLRVVRHNLARYFELRPDVNESAERDDGRNITFRNVTLPLVYVVTAAGLIGLWRARRRRGAELLLLQAAYFSVASVAVIGVPRLRAPLDVAAAIGVGVLAAQLIRPGVPAAANAPRHEQGRAAWSRRTRVLVTVTVIVGVIAASGGIALARTRVESNARSQLRETLEDDRRAIQRLAGVNATNLVDGTAPSSLKADFEQAENVADRLWLLSPRLTRGLRSDGRNAARAVDEGVFELKVLDLATAGQRGAASGAATSAALDEASAAYEARIRPTNARLPDWNTISVNTAMQRAAQDLLRLQRRVST
jgi:hypothetical protein